MNKIQKNIKIKGIVQGVGFRFSAREQARKYGIKGYVKNLPSGDVEIKAVGPEKNVQLYVQWCKQGPPHAHVEDISVEESNPESFQTFDVKH